MQSVQRHRHQDSHEYRRRWPEGWLLSYTRLSVPQPSTIRLEHQFLLLQPEWQAPRNTSTTRTEATSSYPARLLTQTSGEQAVQVSVTDLLETGRSKARCPVLQCTMWKLDSPTGNRHCTGHWFSGETGRRRMGAATSRHGSASRPAPRAETT